VATKDAVCGSPAQHKSAGITYCLATSRENENLFFTAGKYALKSFCQTISFWDTDKGEICFASSNTLRIWELDVPNRKIRPLDVMLGQIKRIIKSITVSEVDDYFFCGTTTGDILQIAYPSGLFKAIGPEKNKFSMGITSIQCIKTGEILVGSGDGKVSLVVPGTFKVKKYV
jgi:hypothetical protein